MRPEKTQSDLNSAHKLHLLSSAQHADKLLGEIESILAASRSKSPFRKYKDWLALAQAKVVQDYLARIRTQLVRVLEAQGVSLPEPDLESVHAMRVTLAFVRIAFQECTPDRMGGYGEVPESRVRDLAGLVDEMLSAVDRLDSYLARGISEDLEMRLSRLTGQGSDVGLVKIMEHIVGRHGLVEFRPNLSMIIDRMETKQFEIALFGRVSSGKSSLLNHMIGSDILPVGVTPITAVPTRIAYGENPRLTVWYADKSPEQLSVSRLPDFVSELHNPANWKRITRILAELPSPRLKQGVTLVDTPGLGSLATSGAAETLAYLPRCDLGVVLIDSGSTLTADDLGTIRGLYEAGIPASIVLSKSDLVSDEDRERSSRYISDQIAAQLALRLPVYAVSIQPSHALLLDSWVSQVIHPLFDRHQQLAEESLARKIGALREAVIVALETRLGRTDSMNSAVIAAADGRMRLAVARIAEVRESCSSIARAVRHDEERFLSIVATALADSRTGGQPPEEVVGAALISAASEPALEIFHSLIGLAAELAATLQAVAGDLNFQEAPADGEFRSAIREMPKLDLGPIQVKSRSGVLLKLSRALGVDRMTGALRREMGQQFSEALASFGSILDAWTRRVLAELQQRFESHADAYRAQLSRMTPRGDLSVSDRASVEQDLAVLTSMAPS